MRSSLGATDTWIELTTGGAPSPAAPDRELLLRANEGEEDAARELVGRHGARLLAVVTAIQKDGALAEDVVQESFLRAIRQGDQLREDASFFTWLVRIAVRAGVDLRRKTWRERLLGATPERVLDEPSALARLTTQEDERRVREALDRLPERARTVIVLRYYAGLSVSEMASALDKSEPAIRKDLQRARDRLKPLLADWFEEKR